MFTNTHGGKQPTIINELYDAMMVLNGTVKADEAKQAKSREIFIEQAEPLRNHTISRLYDVYGAKEMTCSGLSCDDINNELVIVQLEAAKKFVPCTDYKTSTDFRKHWTTFVNLYTANGMRRLIERHNAYSPYYASRLLALKVDGYLDLDEVTVDEAAKCWDKRSKNPIKHPEALLIRLREMSKLKNPEPLRQEQEDAYNMARNDQEFSDLEYTEAFKQIRHSLGEQKWKLFELYYLSDIKPTMKTLSLETGISVYIIKKELKQVAQDVYDYLTGAKIDIDIDSERFWINVLSE